MATQHISELLGSYNNLNCNHKVRPSSGSGDVQAASSHKDYPRWRPRCRKVVCLPKAFLCVLLTHLTLPDFSAIVCTFSLSRTGGIIQDAYACYDIVVLARFTRNVFDSQPRKTYGISVEMYSMPIDGNVLKTWIYDIGEFEIRPGEARTECS